jgi:deoxycytidylate deaminase
MPREVTTSLSRKEKSYLNLAKNLAMSSKCRMKHGAVVVSGGSIISLGINSMKNNPAFISEEHVFDASIHAEVDALRKIKNSVKGGTIYVARVNRQGKPMISRPCDRCYDVIVEMGIGKIVYTD